MSQNFDTDQVKVLTALAKVVIGADALTKVPDLIDDIDDFYNYLSPSSKDDLDRILRLLGSAIFMAFSGRSRASTSSLNRSTRWT